MLDENGRADRSRMSARAHTVDECHSRHKLLGHGDRVRATSRRMPQKFVVGEDVVVVFVLPRLLPGRSTEIAASNSSAAAVPRVRLVSWDVPLFQPGRRIRGVDGCPGVDLDSRARCRCKVCPTCRSRQVEVLTGGRINSLYGQSR